MRIATLKPDQAFWRDVGRNTAGFVAFASAGIVLNIYLVFTLGAEALGIFNQLYAAFVIAGQLAVLGIHDSAQRHLSILPMESSGAAARGALLASFFGATIVALIFFIVSEAYLYTFRSVEVSFGLRILAPGLVLFALNKTTFGILNGKRRFREFAIGQSLRGLLILTIGILVVESALHLGWLALCFTATEFVLFPVLLVMSRRSPILGRVEWTGSILWISRHLSFGLRGLPNGVLAEAFLRIDILILGSFVADVRIGTYAFAAILVEGLYQVGAVIRVVFNPILAQRFSNSNEGNSLSSLLKVSLSTLIAVGAVGLLVLYLFTWMPLVFPEVLVSEARSIYLILFLGMFFYSAALPFESILLQSGRPGLQSLMLFVFVSSNIILNVLLIPRLGIEGAAIATLLALLFSALSILVITFFLHKKGSRS